MDDINMDKINDNVRMDILTRLAEQAMTDEEFRAVARHDLAGALTTYGYDLNESERDLVFRFRASLDEAGIDLFLTEHLTEEHLAMLRDL